ncbi:Type I site-specific restriction endonuclease, part of a restriction-modification system [Nostoc flagelliforme CCNUN1]|uniref:Type I site-specific restriction endonuclease, part of a restriction-modification system n=1 Tax=Nostoc flagelliforme CCNUN1 TaxID=2038116 RepID=A0A2K8T2F6_9NOSO|nr:restriction endonuclease subunit R [Nostoc flagelliforme]AUB41195.1 Type I site-specific restriction endonuclease, part of a restriction-modification system [Nostoc flagelliforme CCNUN1]
MPLIVEASSLSLNDVHRFLKLEELSNGSFTDFLTLEPLSELEQQDLLRIRNDFRRYLSAGKISEGLVKFITIAPLMQLSGFYDVPIRLTMEDSIAIAVEDEDRRITGRMDILAINSPQSNIAPPFWVLVIETKNSSVNVIEGLPQLLTYAFKSLDQQPSVWGLVTNGQLYQFVYLRHDNQSTYELMPLLNLSQSPDAIELLQVFKAICKLPNFQ